MSLLVHQLVCLRLQIILRVDKNTDMTSIGSTGDSVSVVNEGHTNSVKVVNEGHSNRVKLVNEGNNNSFRVSKNGALIVSHMLTRTC